MTLLSAKGLEPIGLEPSTARRIVAAVVLQAYKDVEAMEKRRARHPEAKPMARELDAQEWLQDTTTVRPFSYRWCLDVLRL
ncbi:hypothetical protein [Dyella ginsengisoli]|uniref:hypothetical protein n=1 Tax=Dyella ginsengisoli TaxID=363848 RepID=UPI00034DD2F7|nr:hypothetical protein [Dyella ginsengisoli]